MKYGKMYYKIVKLHKSRLIKLAKVGIYVFNIIDLNSTPQNIYQKQTSSQNKIEN